MAMAEDDDLLWAVTGLRPASPLKVKEESALALAQGVYPPGLWTLLPEAAVRDVAALLCVSTRPPVVSACLAVLLKFSEALKPDPALGARLVLLVSADGPMNVKTSSLLCDAALFSGATNSDMAASLLAQLTMLSSQGSSSVRQGVFTETDAPGILANYGKHALSAGMPRKAIFFALIENLCFKNANGASRLALSGCVDVLSHDALEECSPEALRALTNITNECWAAANKAIRCGILEKLIYALAAKTSALADGGVNLAQTFDVCLLMLGVLANIAEQRVGTLAFLESPGYIDHVITLYAKSLPMRAIVQLQSGDTSSTIEFGWTPEELVLSAHVCIVIGFLVKEPSIKLHVIEGLPGKRGFSPLIQTLDVFLQFQREAGVLTKEAEESIRRVAGYLNAAHCELMLPPPVLPVFKRVR